MELISKEDAVALIKAEMDKIRTHSLVDGTARINLRLAKNIIEDMPSIDIVRCGECKYKFMHGSVWECLYGLMIPSPDGFCSYGARMTDSEKPNNCEDEPTWEQVKEYCNKRCLDIVDSAMRKQWYKDEPQTDKEIVLDPSFAELSDEQFAEAMKLIEPQTDCSWK